MGFNDGGRLLSDEAGSLILSSSDFIRFPNFHHLQNNFYQKHYYFILKSFTSLSCSDFNSAFVDNDNNNFVDSIFSYIRVIYESEILDSLSNFFYLCNKYHL